MNGECLISISDAFVLFCLLFTGIRHLAHVLTVPPTKACLLCATPAGMDVYIQLHARGRRRLPSAVPWISEDRLFKIQDYSLSHQRNGQEDRTVSKSSSHQQRPVSRKL